MKTVNEIKSQQEALINSLQYCGKRERGIAKKKIAMLDNCLLLLSSGLSSEVIESQYAKVILKITIIKNRYKSLYGIKYDQEGLIYKHKQFLSYAEPYGYSLLVYQKSFLEIIIN